jgi:hypothetical protein
MPQSRYHRANNIRSAVGGVRLALLAVAVESRLRAAISAVLTTHCVTRAALACKHWLRWHGSVGFIELRARTVAESLSENACLFELSLCLSRACLGKMIILA